MRLRRVSWWVPLLVAVACGGKSSNHGATSGSGGGAAGEPGKASAGKGGTATDPDPSAGGVPSNEPGGAAGTAAGAAGDSAGDNAGAGEGGAPPAAILRFCDQTSHQYCADFDGEFFDEGWDETSLQGSATVGPIAANSPRAPRSLRSQIKTATYDVSGATLDVTFPGAQSYELAFDLFIDELDLSDYPMLELKLFEVVNGDSSTGLSVTFDEQGDRLWYQTHNINSGLIWGGFIPLHEWVRVLLKVNYGTFGSGAYELQFGDAAPIPWNDTSLGPTPGAIQLKLGLQTNSATAPATVLYDNLTFDRDR